MADNYTDTTDTNFKGIAGGVTYNIDTGKLLSAEGVRNALHTKENVANKKDTIDNNSAEYPSSKAVYDAIQAVNAALAKAMSDTEILPVGTILAMSASSWTNAGTAFKNKWKVCDGTGGTPDLRGRFLRGGTSSDAATGGANSVTLTENHIPSHTHGKGTLAAGGTDGLHTHTATSTFHWYDGNNTSAGHYVIDTDPVNDVWRDTHGKTDRAIDTVVNNTNSGHGHSISGATGSYGKDSATITAIPTVPNYYTVIYIIKVS
ncbi:MAG: hypothetical protein LBD62_04975 [Candidatus Margulisbacteria bacterium]|nr:hypothetical protein [Candidatus Margulisiibacteriota bacterium]